MSQITTFTLQSSKCQLVRSGCVWFSLLVEKIKIKLHNYFTFSILYKYNTTGLEEAFSVALLQAHSFPSDHNINWATAGRIDHVTSSSHCILFFCFHFHSLSQSYRIVLPWPIVSLSGMRPMTIHAVTSDSTTATAPQKNTNVLLLEISVVSSALFLQMIVTWRLGDGHSCALIMRPLDTGYKTLRTLLISRKGVVLVGKYSQKRVPSRIHFKLP